MASSCPNPAVPGKAKVARPLLQLRGWRGVSSRMSCTPTTPGGPDGTRASAWDLHPLVIHAYGGDLLPEQYAGSPALHRATHVLELPHGGPHCRNRPAHGWRRSTARSAPERVVVLPRGVDVERYRPGLDTSELRRAWDWARRR